MLSNLDTYLEALRTSPLEFLLTLVYAVAVILISLILHECAHGYVAYRCGDPTAKMMGRLSLNPKAHLDLIGTLSMFLIGVAFGRNLFRSIRATSGTGGATISSFPLPALRRISACA